MGTWTTSGFFYKPELGANGSSEKQTYDSGLDRADARLGREIWLGDPIYGSSLPQAIAVIGNSPAILYCNMPTQVNQSLSVPANVQLVAVMGCLIAIKDGVTLQVNAPFQAGLFKVFDCLGSGRVSFGAGSVEAVWAEWWGAKGDNVTDCSSAIVAALRAMSSGMTLRFGAGTFLTDPINLGATRGIKVLGCGPSATVLKSRTGGDVFNTHGGYIHEFEMGGFTVDGNNGSGHGIHFHDNGPYGGIEGVHLHDIVIQYCGGNGIHVPDGIWHSLIANVHILRVAGNGFDMTGSNTNTMIRCYPQNVGPGMTGFRLRTGTWTLIGCNGVNDVSKFTWGVFGSETVEGDPITSGALISMIGCNVESFASPGIYCKTSVALHLQDVTFVTAPTGSAVTAILVKYPVGNCVIDSGTVFVDQGCGWRDGEPIHTTGGAGAPCVMRANSNIYRPLTFRNDDTSARGYNPSIEYSVAPNYRATLKVPRLSTAVLCAVPTNVPYAATMVLDGEAGATQIIEPTNANPFSILPPYFPYPGQEMSVVIVNTRAGALGTCTWHQQFHLCSPWTQPDSQCRREISFRFDAMTGAWYERYRSSGNVPN